jgi:hypothetical protein
MKKLIELPNDEKFMKALKQAAFDADMSVKKYLEQTVINHVNKQSKKTK